MKDAIIEKQRELIELLKFSHGEAQNFKYYKRYKELESELASLESSQKEPAEVSEENAKEPAQYPLNCTKCGKIYWLQFSLPTAQLCSDCNKDQSISLHQSQTESLENIDEFLKIKYPIISGMSPKNCNKVIRSRDYFKRGYLFAQSHQVSQEARPTDQDCKSESEQKERYHFENMSIKYGDYVPTKFAAMCCGNSFYDATVWFNKATKK